MQLSHGDSVLDKFIPYFWKSGLCLVTLGVNLGLVVTNICAFLTFSLNSISPISCQVPAQHLLQSQETVQHIWADHTLHFLVVCTQILSSRVVPNFTVFLWASFPHLSACSPCLGCWSAPLKFNPVCDTECESCPTCHSQLRATWSSHKANKQLEELKKTKQEPF